MTQQQTTKDLVEARQGETSGHMRWVLAISTVSAFIIMGAIYLWFMHAH